MKRVHRALSKQEVEALREKLSSMVPTATADIPEVLRTMRMITRKSQTEYARLCGVAPRVLADIEAGKGAATLKTLRKLLKPFGATIGVVSEPAEL